MQQSIWTKDKHWKGKFLVRVYVRGWVWHCLAVSLVHCPSSTTLSINIVTDIGHSSKENDILIDFLWMNSDRYPNTTTQTEISRRNQCQMFHLRYFTTPGLFINVYNNRNVTETNILLRAADPMGSKVITAAFDMWGPKSTALRL